MTQRLLFAVEAPTGLACSFGYQWPGDHLTPHGCPGCSAEVERACVAFEAAVARGEFDTEGYTPNERKAQAKRRQTS